MKRRITRVASYGLVTSRHKILLCRLSKDLLPWTGQWTLPGGGLEFGEDPEDAMIREVREETGLWVRPRGLAGIDSFCDEREEGAFHGLRILYYTELVGGELSSETNGSTDFCAWWSLEEANGLRLVDLALTGLEYAFPSVTREPSPPETP